jgi:hypothetical protein
LNTLSRESSLLTAWAPACGTSAPSNVTELQQGGDTLALANGMSLQSRFATGLSCDWLRH